LLKNSNLIIQHEILQCKIYFIKDTPPNESVTILILKNAEEISSQLNASIFKNVITSR
jgi:hypothetical protein